MSYTKTLEMQHNEVPAIVNIETGEVKTFEAPTQRIPKDHAIQYFKHDEPYQRTFTRAWELLETQTTDLEFKAAQKMARLAKAFTNSMEPISPDSTVREIGEALHIDYRKVTKIVEKLFKLGVIAKFEVYEQDSEHHKYWIFNPYLSFNGMTIPKKVSTMFDKTWYANL